MEKFFRRMIDAAVLPVNCMEQTMEREGEDVAKMRWYKKGWRQGSYTAEAAFVMPFGFLVLMSLSCLFTGLLRQNNIQVSLVRVAQTYGIVKSKSAAADTILQEKVLVRWKESEGDQLCFAEYNEAVPFLGTRFFRLRHYQQMIVSDYEGESMTSEEIDGRIVYIAQNGTVYHDDRECTYLRTRIQEYTVHQVQEKRNQSGGIYYPCESCCQSKAQAMERKVYIASYGDRYHIQSQCPRLKRTVRAVHLSQVGNLPPCSKCGRADG